MEEKFDKALASKMRNLFEEHGDEAYELGAWEAFEANVYNSGSNPYRFLWIGLAACFLMAMSIDTIYNSSYDGIKSSSLIAFEGKMGKATGVEHAFDVVGIDQNRLTGLKTMRGKIFESEDPIEQHSSFPGLISFNKIKTEDLSKYDFSSTEGIEKFDVLESYPKENSIAPFMSRPHKSLKAGLMVTSLVNQYDGAQPNLNFGAGVMMDIPLIRNLSLNTGIVLSQQNITFKPSQVENNAEGSRMIASKVRLLSFDFPINLKYTFIRRKKREMFVAGGISSLTYAKADFKETYQANREVKSNVYNDRGEHSEVVALVKSQEYKNSSEKPFSTFDFGKLLNLSIGVELPIEEQLSLIVEPFIKYPLGSLTSKDIKYSSAGISLKLNMGLAKVN